MASTLGTASGGSTGTGAKAHPPAWESAAWRRVVSAGRSVTSFSVLTAAMLGVAVYWTCRDRISDPDIWWHLRNAQYLVANLRFPTVDTYSFTTAGSRWMDHEWLAELCYYAGWHALGIRGVFVVFTATLVTLIVAIFVMSIRESGDVVASGIATILGMLLALVGFGPRTQNFGWLCFAAVFAILLRFRSARRAPLWLLPAVFCLWINCHGTWIFGLATYAIVLLAGLVRRDIGHLAADPWSQDELKRLARFGVLSVAALFLNPFGYHLVLFPVAAAFHAVSGHVQSLSVIQEFSSINFQDARGKLVMVVLLAVFATALTGRKRWRIDDALLTAFALYCGLTHVRLLLLTGILLPPILAPQFGRLSSYRGGNERRALNSLLLAGIAAVFVLGFPTSTKLEGQIARDFPVHAVEYLHAHPQQGNMFNLYDWGGYLEWNLPEARTFIDGRGDLINPQGLRDDHLDDYSAVTGMVEPQEILDRYRVAYVLYPPGTPLCYFLSRSPEWEHVYEDERAVIFRRAAQAGISKLTRPQE